MVFLGSSSNTIGSSSVTTGSSSFNDCVPV
nr:MAG TPA: hypothetical protein [Caudoviricetes sp.]